MKRVDILLDISTIDEGSMSGQQLHQEGIILSHEQLHHMYDSYRFESVQASAEPLSPTASDSRSEAME